MSLWRTVSAKRTAVWVCIRGAGLRGRWFVAASRATTVMTDSFYAGGFGTDYLKKTSSRITADTGSRLATKTPTIWYRTTRFAATARMGCFFVTRPREWQATETGWRGILLKTTGKAKEQPGSGSAGRLTIWCFG